MDYIQKFYSIGEFHTPHIYLQIDTKIDIFLSSYLHWQFKFKYGKVIEQKKSKFLRTHKNNPSLST